MKLTFANSAYLNAPEGAMLRGGRWRSRLRLRVRYGVLEHPGFGPVLIDTGYDRASTQAPGRSLALRAYTRVLRPQILEHGQIGAVLRQLGYDEADVSKIIITHFHADHVSALRRFPNAEVFANRHALTEILQNSHLANLRHGVFTELFPPDLAERVTDCAVQPKVPAPLNLPDGHDLFGDGSAIAIDLPGHAAGHFGLCFPKVDPHLLYACDVQWINRALTVSPAVSIMSRIVSQNSRAASATTVTVAKFVEAGGKVLLCHDPSPSAYDLQQGQDV